MESTYLTRLVSGAVLTAILFTQVGLSLLHSHQGVPEKHPVAVHAGVEGSGTCQACALDGVPTLYSEEFSPLVFGVNPTVFDETIAEPTILSSFRPSSGRAPPHC